MKRWQLATIFSVLFLATVGTQQAFAGPLQNVGDFKCWSVSDQVNGGPDTPVTLQDQFGTMDVTLNLDPASFCASAEKDGVPSVFGLNQHYVQYGIDEFLPPLGEEVNIYIPQFDLTLENVELGRPEFILGPVGKDILPFNTGPDTPQPDFESLTDVHFKCYEIPFVDDERQVNLLTQFDINEITTTVNFAGHFCTPVIKEHAGQTSGTLIDEHLTCYFDIFVPGAPRSPQNIDVRIFDQFYEDDPLQILLQNSNDVCFESLKLCPTGTTGAVPNCTPTNGGNGGNGGQAIGGEIIPIEQTSLLLANTQSFSWMIPVILSGIGIGLFIVGRKSE